MLNCGYVICFLADSRKALGPRCSEETALLTRHRWRNDVCYHITVLQTSTCSPPCWHNIGLWNIVYLDHVLHVSLPHKYLHTNNTTVTRIWIQTTFHTFPVWHKKESVVLMLQGGLWSLRVHHEVNIMLSRGKKWNKCVWDLGHLQISGPEWKEATERQDQNPVQYNLNYSIISIKYKLKGHNFERKK